MNEKDYRIIVKMAQLTEQIHNFTKHQLQNSLEVFRNRPRTTRVTMPKAVCLLFTYWLTKCAQGVSDDCRKANPQVPWEKIATLEGNIFTREEGFFNAENAWDVLTKEVPQWDLACCEILAAHNPNYEADIAYKHSPTRHNKPKPAKMTEQD